MHSPYEVYRASVKSLADLHMLAPRKTLWSTPTAAIDEAISLARIDKNDVCYDVGCGNGNFLIRCSEKTGARCVGIEINEERAKEAVHNIEAAGLEHLARVVVGNALEQDYSDATVFFLYLVPRGLRLIRPILQAAAQPLRVVTYMSPLPDEPHVQMVRVTPPHQPSAAWPLYLYHLDGGEGKQGTPLLRKGEGQQLCSQEEEEEAVSCPPPDALEREGRGHPEAAERGGLQGEQVPKGQAEDSLGPTDQGGVHKSPATRPVTAAEE